MVPERGVTNGSNDGSNEGSMTVTRGLTSDRLDGATAGARVDVLGRDVGAGVLVVAGAPVDHVLGVADVARDDVEGARVVGADEREGSRAPIGLVEGIVDGRGVACGLAETGGRAVSRLVDAGGRAVAVDCCVVVDEDSDFEPLEDFLPFPAKPAVGRARRAITTKIEAARDIRTPLREHRRRPPTPYSIFFGFLV